MTCAERPTINVKEIGQRIRAARRSRQWKLRHLADALDVTPGTISLWEAGRREPRSVATWARLSIALRRSLDWLLLGLPKNARQRRNESDQTTEVQRESPQNAESDGRPREVDRVD